MCHRVLRYTQLYIQLVASWPLWLPLTPPLLVSGELLMSQTHTGPPQGVLIALWRERPGPEMVVLYSYPRPGLFDQHQGTEATWGWKEMLPEWCRGWGEGAGMSFSDEHLSPWWILQLSPNLSNRWNGMVSRKSWYLLCPGETSEQALSTPALINATAAPWEADGQGFGANKKKREGWVEKGGWEAEKFL